MDCKENEQEVSVEVSGVKCVVRQDLDAMTTIPQMVDVFNQVLAGLGYKREIEEKEQQEK